MMKSEKWAIGNPTAILAIKLFARFARKKGRDVV
jgi:hypothetical protein